MMNSGGATVQVAMIHNPDNTASSWFETEELARRDMETSHQDYDFSIVRARLKNDAGKVVAEWDPEQARWTDPVPAHLMPTAAPKVVKQEALPGMPPADLESLVRQMTAAGQLIHLRVEHRMATTKGWREGWFASVGYFTRPADRDGEHPCVCLANHPDGPVEALVAGLHKALDHIEQVRAT